MEKLKSWNLLATKIGKITNVNVKLNRVVLFSGENNAGKSYLMYIAWNITKVYNKANLMSSLSKQHKYELSKYIENRENIIISPEISNQVITEFENYIKNNNDDLCKQTFEYKNINIKNLRVEFPRFSDEIVVKFEDKNDIDKTTTYVTLGRPYKYFSNEKMTFFDKDNSFLSRYIIFVIMSHYVGFNFEIVNNSYYLPPSKSSLILSKDDLKKSTNKKLSHYNNDIITAEKYNDIYGNLKPKSIDIFLRDLSRLIEKTQKDGIWNEEFAKEFEDKIMNGKIRIIDNDISYKPNGAKEYMPIKVASSMIQELLPIYLVTASSKYNKSDLLVLEEPEVHLHPKIQYLLGKILLRYYELGNSFWSTTHSEYIAHAINNAVKYHYIKHHQIDDIFTEEPKLDIDDVEVYNVKTIGDETKIIPCKKSNTGIVMQGFNDFLKELRNETTFVNDVLNNLYTDNEDE